MRIAEKAQKPQEMEYSPASRQMTKKREEKRKVRTKEHAVSFLNFPVFSWRLKFLDRSGRSLSPVFPQKNRSACLLHTREIRENTHRHKIVISVSQAASLFCIRILLSPYYSPLVFFSTPIFFFHSYPPVSLFPYFHLQKLSLK